MRLLQDAYSANRVIFVRMITTIAIVGLFAILYFMVIRRRQAPISAAEQIPSLPEIKTTSQQVRHHEPENKNKMGELADEKSFTSAILACLC